MIEVHGDTLMSALPKEGTYPVYITDVDQYMIMVDGKAIPVFEGDDK